jgi:excinuclease UvrABC ATPase subunit
MGEGMSDLHEIRTNAEGWDTKVHCTCGFESVSRCEQWKHAADALRDRVRALESAPDEVRDAIRRALPETGCSVCGGKDLDRAAEHIAAAVQPFLDRERKRYEALEEFARNLLTLSAARTSDIVWDELHKQAAALGIVGSLRGGENAG